MKKPVFFILAVWVGLGCWKMQSDLHKQIERGEKLYAEGTLNAIADRQRVVLLRWGKEEFSIRSSTAMPTNHNAYRMIIRTRP